VIVDEGRDMHQQSSAQSVAENRWATLGALALLAGLVCVARYWHSGQFGLYEDDFTRIPEALTMTALGIWGRIAWSFSNWVDHGKPLHPSLIYFLTFLGGRLGGLRALYGIGYLIFTSNVFLFYALLRRLQRPAVALLGGIGYALFSADTTQAFLTHSFGLQTSMLFLLLAFHAFLSRRRWVAYLIIPLILITYETPFPVFLAAPLLLAERWDRRLLGRLVRHALILGLLLAVTVAIRYAIGESRVSGLTPISAIATPIVHMIEGPLVAMGTYFLRPVQALRGLTVEVATASLLAFALLLWVFSRSRFGSPLDLRTLLALLKERPFLQSLPEEVKSLLRLGAAGLAMLILAYPLTFTIPAYALRSRETRVHLAAVVGASILWACAGSLIVRLADGFGRRRLANIALAGLFAMLVGFGFAIQRDYVLAWRYQQEFWADLVALIPDADRGTVVLVDPGALQDVRQMGANTWNLPRILDQIYVFPAEWRDPPRVFRLAPGWEEHIVTEAGLFTLDGVTTVAPPSLYQTVASERVILIEAGEGGLIRRTAPLVIAGVEFPLKGQTEAVLPTMEKGNLYDYLIRANAE
jgi:hypothetical protein